MTDSIALREAWALRNAATATLVKAEDQMRLMLASATPGEIISLIEAFSPARSSGPEWTRTYEPLLERLWEWCRPEVLVTLEADFRSRGPAWLAIANSLTPERGAIVRSRIERHSAQSRLPAFTIE